MNDFKAFWKMTRITYPRCYICNEYDMVRCRWFSAKLRYLQCVSNGDTAVLHQAIGRRYALSLNPENRHNRAVSPARCRFQHSSARRRLAEKLHSRVESWWRHCMDTLTTLLALCEGHQPGGAFSTAAKRRFYVSVNCWINSRSASKLRRHNANVTSLYW